MAGKYYAYILECADGTYYTGYTNDPEKRLQTHNAGKGGKYTRTRLPVRLVYSEEFETRNEAMSREWHIKQLTRKEKEELVKGNI
ncbi:MAG: GIY-YIG nuclease family protein [Lachnospiraceae bacterium]|nr:GIY-YIG nuclease family protein [Lachnospiraceae bacterium]